MRKTLKIGLCFLLCVSLAFSLSACGSSAVTQDNITKTVSLVEKALREFDKDTLKKYVDSKTLNYIFQLAGSGEQFETIGKLLFENLEMSVKSVNTESKTVTLEIKNKDLENAGRQFSKFLKVKSGGGSTVEMLKLLGDEEFLDLSVKVLTALISRATVPDNPKEVTVYIRPEKKNLVLVFGQDAENAVSGGAISSITEAFGVTTTKSDAQN